MELAREVWACFTTLTTLYLATTFVWRHRGTTAERAGIALALRPLVHVVSAVMVLGLHGDLPAALWTVLWTVLWLGPAHFLGAFICRSSQSPGAFLIAQAMNLAAAALLTWSFGLTPRSPSALWEAGLIRDAPGVLFVVLALGGSYLAVVELGGEFVGRVVRPHLDELERALQGPEARLLQPRRGLARAGRVIGRLERTLVLLLLLMGQPAGIGFLVAAKSIFRFGELRDTANRMESEYIIIGTLASFAYALAIGWMSVTWVDAVRAGAGLD